MPGNSTAPFIISPMMHPTDHMSTENKNDMEINKKTGIEGQTNEDTDYPCQTARPDLSLTGLEASLVISNSLLKQ